MNKNYFVSNREGNDLIDPFLRDLFNFSYGERQESKLMKTDVKDEGDHYKLMVDIPSVKKEDVSLELEDGYLKITAKTSHNSEEKDDNGKFIRKERFYGTYSRDFFVGKAVKEEDIKAKLENGVLTLTVAKAEEKVENKKIIAIE